MPTRRDFLKRVGQVEAVGVIGGLGAWGYYLIGNPFSIHHSYTSISDAKKALVHAADKKSLNLADVSGLYTIHGRVKSITPEAPSLEDHVHLVLSDGKSDFDFYFKKDNILLPDEEVARSGLFSIDYEETRRRTDTHRELVMGYLRLTHIGDQVGIITQPVFYVDNSCYGIVDYRNFRIVPP